MNIIAISELRKLSKVQMEELLPLMVTSDGEPFVKIDKHDLTITMSDLHPRVQMQFRNREAIVRAGMPKPQVIHADEVPRVIEPQSYA